MLKAEACLSVNPHHLLACRQVGDFTSRKGLSALKTLKANQTAREELWTYLQQRRKLTGLGLRKSKLLSDQSHHFKVGKEPYGVPRASRTPSGTDGP